jgi:hypothetical protein
MKDSQFTVLIPPIHSSKRQFSKNSSPKTIHATHHCLPPQFTIKIVVVYGFQRRTSISNWVTQPKRRQFTTKTIQPKHQFQPTIHHHATPQKLFNAVEFPLGELFTMNRL